MPDEVDTLLAQWGRERPDLDVAPMAVFSRVSRLAQLVETARQQAFADHGLTGWEFDVLSALRRAGEPYALSPGALVRLTHVTSGTMTNRIQRLVTRGAVTRDPDPTDRRAAVIALTDAGRRSVDGALADLLAAEGRLLGPLTDAERSTLAGLLGRLMSGFDVLD